MDKLPFAFQWHITETCDQRCKHFYIFEGKNIEAKRDLDIYDGKFSERGKNIKNSPQNR